MKTVSMNLKIPKGYVPQIAKDGTLVLVREQTAKYEKIETIGKNGNVEVFITQKIGNPEKKGVNVQFPKEDLDTRAKVKALGFRFSPMSKVWYRYDSDQARKDARSLLAPTA